MRPPWRWPLGLLIAALAYQTWTSVRARTEPSAYSGPHEIRARVFALGVLEPKGGTAKVRTSVEGCVLTVAVREGDAVQPGDRLAELVVEGSDSEIARLRAEVSAAEAESTAASEGPSEPSRAQIHAELGEERTELALLEAQLERATRLQTTGAIASAEVDDLRTRTDAARYRVAGANARLDSGQRRGA